MVIAQIEHPTRQGQPLQRHLPQPPTLIDRRHTLIGRTQRPGPTTHTPHHQQTPEPIINNHPIRDQTLHTHTGIATIINNHTAAINTAFVAGDNTSVSRITVNTIIAHFYRTVPHATAADAITDTHITDGDIVDIIVARNGVLWVVQDRV